MDNFKWTDELVKEFCNWFNSIPISEVYKKDRFNEFKENHTKPIKVKGFTVLMTEGKGKDCRFYTTGDVPKEKMPLIEQAIEQVLNDDTVVDLRKYGSPDINVDWSNCGKKYTEKDLEDAFNAARIWGGYGAGLNRRYPKFRDYINHK